MEWKGWELHPERPPEGVPREALQGERYRRAHEHLKMLAAGAGLVFNPPPVVANTHLALEASEFAREHGAFEKLHRRLFEAYFQEGVNIGDAEALIGLARESGLEAEELRRVLAEHSYVERLAETAREAHRLGITGVPTFIVGRWAVVGAQPYDVLRDAALRAGAKPRGA